VHLFCQANSANTLAIANNHHRLFGIGSQLRLAKLILNLRFIEGTSFFGHPTDIHGPSGGSMSNSFGISSQMVPKACSRKER
jgi:hypothetical protein